MKTDEMIDALRQDKIDVGIAATPLEERGIIERVLYCEPFMEFVPEYHEMTKDKFLLASEINSKELLLLNEGHCFRNSVLKLCQDQYRSFIKPIAEPTPSREISILHSRTQLKLEWIQALETLIVGHLPEKVLQVPEKVVKP